MRWAWLHFKKLNRDERCLYLRHEGHEMKLKFMTPRQSQVGSTHVEGENRKRKNRKRRKIKQKEGKLKKKKRK